MEQERYESETEKLLSSVNSKDELYDLLNQHEWFSAVGRTSLSLSDYGDILEFTRSVDVERYCDMEVAFDRDSYQKTLAKMAMQSCFADLCERMEED